MVLLQEDQQPRTWCLDCAAVFSTSVFVVVIHGGPLEAPRGSAALAQLSSEHHCLNGLSGQMTLISCERKEPLGCWSDWLTLFFSTYRGDTLDFEPAEDARQLVGHRVGGPLNPHVLQQENRESE